MQDAILHKHTNPPSTCDRNNNRQPIDAIWTTPGLVPVFSGYLPFDQGCPSDHRLLWLDLVKDTFLGNSPKLAIPKPHRLKASDPCLVEKYNQLLLPAINGHNLLHQIRTIQIQANKNGWNQNLETEYNTINNIQLDIRRKIETKIRKLCTGGKPWSPTLQKQRDTIWAISLLIKKRNRHQVSNRLIRRTLQKTDLIGAYSKTLAELCSMLNNAFAQYKQSNAESLCKEFLPSHAQARAPHYGTQYETELQQLVQMEQQRKLS